MKTSRTSILITCAVALLLGTLLYARYVFPELTLNSFYCAGEAVRTGNTPYLVEPLRSCEHRAAPTEPLQNAGGVEPAPLPGYALAAFAAFSLLPLKFAHLFFAWLLMAALLVAAYAVARLTGYAFPAVLLAFVPAGFVNLVYGEIPPLIVAAVALAGLFAAQRKYELAGGVAAITMLEPHVGLPCCAALFLWLPRTRKTLLVCGAAAAVASVLALGFERNVDYFRTVLPAQAASELDANDQYSLTRLLYVLGVAGPLALRIGGISYLAMAALGIVLGKVLARRLDEPELIVFLPAATVLLGGSYIHDLQMVFALPAALVLMRHARRGAALLWAATILLAIVWDHQWGIYTPLFFVTPILFPWLIREAPSLRARMLGSAIAIAMLGAVLVTTHHSPNGPAQPSRAPMPAGPLEPQRNASIAWNAWLRANPSESVPTLGDFVTKLPTWFGLIVLIGTGIGMTQLETRGIRRAPAPAAAASGR
jgi:hypothetical protein